MEERSLLLVRIAGEMAAIESERIQSVVELDNITPVPRAPAHVVGLAALRSKAMTVVNCRCSLELAASEAVSEGEILALAVVVEIDEYLYALVVDRVEEVVPLEGEPAPLRADLLPGWTRATLGMVETTAGPALLLDPDQLVAGPSNREAA
ncbi:chemotaxis protein CheW [Altererythrobacter salegens]|uniref:Chemotaxis protein CheW n=1 Tax=Croceibacterium salegens TaxID=1737568 RepID=A0A6I4SUX0_9SPHN|nr:chemotaxis protein CheW [Croceibacterium salegens]MXO59805.1 chemotaxis protein CheW [Croceibacterium salegens]